LVFGQRVRIGRTDLSFFEPDHAIEQYLQNPERMTKDEPLPQLGRKSLPDPDMANWIE
jgi:hypothetical protein